MTAIRLGANTDSLAAQSELNQSTSALTQSYQRLSSGLRINNASDDAAGLAIVSQLDSKTRVLTQAIRNVNDGVSVANIAEGALNSLKQISQRQLELAEEAANGTYSLNQRQALNKEANALVDEYNRIVGTTTFNGMNLLDPSLGTVMIQAGYGQAGALQLGLSNQLQRAVGNGNFTGNDTQTNSNADPATSYATADVNGDGILDVVSADWGNTAVGVLIGNGDGTFKAETTLSTSNPFGGIRPNQVKVGDFNGDGKADIVAVTGDGDSEVFLGNGNGTFKSSEILTGGGANIGVTVGDFDGNGRDDIAVEGSASGFAAVYLSNADGTFQGARTLNVGTAITSITSGDFNGDNTLDILTDNTNGTLSLFIGNGNGTFQAAAVQNTGFTPGILNVGDFDGNGTLDVASANANGTLSILLNNGNGTFKAATTLTTPGNNRDIQIGDLNGDGKIDIVSSYYIASGDTGLSIFLGNGDGTFGAQVTIAVNAQLITNSHSPAITLGDFNGDGRTDLVTNSDATAGNKNTEVFLGNGGYTSTAPYLNINTQQGARNALNTVNNNLNRIEAQLGVIGATTNRFQFEIGNLQTETENFQSAASRIQDVDVAQETANLVREQILQQTSASILAHANQEPALVLKLLG